MAVLDVLDDPHAAGLPLRQDDRHRVIPPQIPYRVHFQQRIEWHQPDAPRLLSLGDLVEVDRAIHGRHASAFPDVPVLRCRHLRLGVQALQFQLVREPRVVAVVHLDDDGPGRRIGHEPLIGRVRLQLRVERDPDLGFWLADGGNQDVPALFTDRLGFLNPHQIAALKRLDRVHRVRLQAAEHGIGASGRAADLSLKDLEQRAKTKRADLIGQQRVNRLLQALLHLARTQHPAARGRHAQHDGTGYAPRLARAAPAMHDLVPSCLCDDRLKLWREADDGKISHCRTRSSRQSAHLQAAARHRRARKPRARPPA